jgi:vacuolar-type H+-ATPase subunit H
VTQADRRGGLEAEVGPVLTLLESADAEDQRIIAQAWLDAEQILAAAHVEAAAIAADAERHAQAVREAAARQVMALALNEAERALDGARRQATQTRELAHQRMPDMVGRTLEMIRHLESDGP